MKLKRVCIFSGASSGNNPEYINIAKKLGIECAKRGITVVYGGGNMGLMGACAAAAIDNNAYVVSVIPTVFHPEKVCGISHGYQFVVADMHVRKEIMSALSDAFIALPGGLGTLEELTEMACWTTLGVHHRKPVGLINSLNYYEGFLKQFSRGIEDGFIRENQRQVILADADPSILLDLLEACEVEDIGFSKEWTEFETGIKAVREYEEFCSKQNNSQ